MLPRKLLEHASVFLPNHDVWLISALAEGQAFCVAGHGVSSSNQRELATQRSVLKAEQANCENYAEVLSFADN